MKKKRYIVLLIILAIYVIAMYFFLGANHLKKEKDYIRNKMKNVEIHTYRPISHEKNFSGVLKDFDEKTVTIENDTGEIVFEKKDIALIRQALDF